MKVVVLHIQIGAAHGIENFAANCESQSDVSTIYNLQSLEKMLETGEQTNKQ